MLVIQTLKWNTGKHTLQVSRWGNAKDDDCIQNHERRNSDITLLILLLEISLRFQRQRPSLQLQCLNKAKLCSCLGGWTRKNEHRHTEAGRIAVLTLTQVVTASFSHWLRSDFRLPRLHSFKRIGAKTNEGASGSKILIRECGEGLCVNESFIG